MEILNHGETGLLFKTNNEYDLFLKLIKYSIILVSILINLRNTEKNLKNFLSILMLENFQTFLREFSFILLNKNKNKFN